jgi:hypothetical protein
MTSKFGAFCLGLSIIAGAALLRNGIVTYRQLGNTIEVRGLDERSVRSDLATWQVRYLVSAQDVKTLYANAANMSGNVVEFLNARGFSKEEIQKTPLVVSDRSVDGYNNNPNAPRFSGRASVMVSTKKVDSIISAVEATDSLLERGVILEGSDVSYYFTGLNSIKPDMLKAASQSATVAAESLARDTGVKLGKIKQVSQGLFSISSPYSDAEYTAASSVMKQVRVVTKAEYAIE